MKIKKPVTIMLCIAMLFCLSACGQSDESEGEGTSNDETSETAGTSASQDDAAGKDEIVLSIFAAASMTETLQEISEIYKEIAPHVTLILSFESSGTLKTQIQEGADCDLFISAGQKQMDELDSSNDEELNPEGLDFVVQGTRVDLLNNEVNLCVPENNPAEIESFADLADALQNEEILFAMGNSDVPVGQYTQKILSYLSLDEGALASAGKITYGTNVKEVTTWISEGSAAAGVVYCTDAYSAGLTIVDTATEEMCGKVIYPAAVMNNSENADEAKAFLKYLQGDEAMEVFKKVGFSDV